MKDMEHYIILVEMTNLKMINLKDIKYFIILLDLNIKDFLNKIYYLKYYFFSIFYIKHLEKIK